MSVKKDHAKAVKYSNINSEALLEDEQDENEWHRGGSAEDEFPAMNGFFDQAKDAATKAVAAAAVEQMKNEIFGPTSVASPPGATHSSVSSPDLEGNPFAAPLNQ